MRDTSFLDRLRETVRNHLPQFRRQVALGQDYAFAFDSLQGRRVLTDILRKAGVLEVGYAEGGKASDSVFNDGRRYVGLEIIQMLRWSEGELLQLARERTTEEVNDARQGAETGETNS